MSKAARMHGAIDGFERLPHVGTAPARAMRRAGLPVSAHPLVGLIRNPRSHHNVDRTGKGAPPSYAPNIIARSPAKRNELAAILEHFAQERVDYIAIDGGDGTVRDVLTCGAGVFGESWPPLIVLPHGKTNALAYDLKIPADWTLDHALAAIRQGNTVTRRPLVVTQRDRESARVSGFVLGGGAFTMATKLGQNAHDLGAFNAAVVGVTAAWSALQAMLGRSGNRWRQGTPMRLRQMNGEEVPHFGGTAPQERYVLFASTLRNFPAGLRPFGNEQGRLRLALLDHAKRTLLMRLPLIFFGRAGAALHRMGFHIIGTDRIDLDIGDQFILDGEAFPAGSYRLEAGAKLRFVVP